MIEPIEADLVIYQGGKFEQPIIVKNNGAIQDLTGYSARMQIREWKDSPTFLHEFTTANNKIVITPGAGRVTILVSGNETAGYTFGDGFYDVEIVDPGSEPIRIAHGQISLNRNSTR